MSNVIESAYSSKTDRVVTALFSLLAFIAFLPVLLVFIVSVSSQESVASVGYSFIPQSFSLEAYRYLVLSGAYLARAFINSVLITVIGTVLGLMLMCPFAYALSRNDFRYRRALFIFIMIPMLFSGGLVSSYMINTQLFHLGNTYLALFLPGLCSTWYILIMRNYFQDSIPSDMVDAAMLDGCTHPQIFLWIVLPVSKPVIIKTGDITYSVNVEPSEEYLKSSMLENGDPELACIGQIQYSTIKEQGTYD